MKKLFILIMVLIMVLGIVGCGAKSSGVTTDDILNGCNNFLSDSEKIEEFDLVETSEGFSFESDFISGTADKKNNVNYIKFTNTDTDPLYYMLSNNYGSYLDFHAELQNLLSMPISRATKFVNIYDCAKEIEMLCKLCFDNNDISILDEKVYNILTSESAVTENEWTITVTIDHENQITTVEAKYGE